MLSDLVFEASQRSSTSWHGPTSQFDEFALKLEKRPDVDRFPNGLMR
jgi:hypothetical protein